MEIAKKKVLYTTFAALILSSFTLQTGKADEVQASPDKANIDYVNSEAPAPAPLASQVDFSAVEAKAEPASQVTSVVTSTSLMVVSSSETDEGLLEVHSQVDIVETRVSKATPHSEGAQVQAFSAGSSTATSERGDAKPASDSEQAKPNIVLTYDKSREATATAESQAVTSMYKSESTLYTSELAGNTHAIEKSEFSSLNSHTTSVSATNFSQAVATSELASEAASTASSLASTNAEASQSNKNTEESLTVLTVGWKDSTSTSEVFETSVVVSMLQSESLTYSSEVTFTDGLISEILATPITSEVYTVVPKRDSTGSLLEDHPAVTGNTDILYLARGEIFNVNFDVNKMDGKKIKGLNLVLDGKQIHHSYFVEGTLDEVNAGLSAYHLAEQTTGIHKMTFELIDTDNNIHYLTQTFSVFNDGDLPVTPGGYPRTQYPSTTTTMTIPVTYNTSVNNYTEAANHIQATAVNELAETTRALTQQLADQIAEVLSGWSSAISGSNTTSSGSIDIFQAASKTITQAARKIAETISDPDTVGKQALAAATVVLVLLVLYLAAITFI
ncbi:hypothetical protein [Streptococcus raffinosi]|uniref:Uncharacterized protein n=1 Tax=Streptococcus raffinosi TaxID=3053355 RepID=A0ABT7LUA6_9STRE|nr:MULTISPECIES: hypothetical protein [unclassified Streptococcus]MDL5044225.1 hypothetical protein [Streptococcus sp. VTCC 12812]MDM0095410.1 hypothetical protein [Streptococcus sp. VTCC 12813]